MNTETFDYPFDPSLVAQHPVDPRDSSKLLLCASQGSLGNWKKQFTFFHHRFSEIEQFLTDGDLLVFNDSKVLPVRLIGQRESTRGKVELLLLRKIKENTWRTLAHFSAKPKPGIILSFEPGLFAEVCSNSELREQTDGEVEVRFFGPALDAQPLEDWLKNHGHVPLPPYIERKDSAHDRDVYQTVYAKKEGSAAAPTAGFHFTENLLSKLSEKKVETAFVTLNVGLGTFRPIKVSTISDHQMHEETFSISEEFSETFQRARQQKKRIVAVGTTTVRALESWASDPRPGTFATKKFITPGYKFEIVDDLITNFHLPKSTLLVLVSAAMSGNTDGISQMKLAYQNAIEEKYRFFSYGDAMFIRNLGEFNA
ncbi:MAG: tRNA preQ1(34) S-adenosylmethionine ribosyltransferase-isomerase QueA [Bacteriovoracia bacterium]